MPDLKEVILATNPTVEGEVTAYHIAKLLQPLGITASRIAHGVPMGGELEYLGGDTLTHASTPDVPALPGFKKVQPQVYAGVFPVNSDDYENFREVLILSNGL